MTAEPAARSEQRERLIAAFRNGDEAIEVLAAEASQLLRASLSARQTIFDVARDELLAEFLKSSLVFPDWFELSMTQRRLALLFTQPREELAPFAACLAIQCHLNEYAWNEDPPETERVESLAANLANLSAYEVMVLACYRPLAGLPGADALLDRGWEGPVREVLQEQIVAVREEAAIAAALPTLTPVSSESSRAVQAQYETNPYPRWLRTGKVPVAAHIHGRPVPRDMQVLIAGCGTGRHAILSALAFPHSRTLAVDLSRASLAYAVRKTRELGLEHRLTYGQADLLDLDWEERFDVVQSTGVLHHMADPFEGARKVCRMAKPGGLIALGLYSAKARAVLNPAKQMAKAYTPQTVRALRRAILDLPVDDRTRAALVESRDFFSTSGCRDLLMHVQEHQLTIPDLRRIMDENRLTFLGFAQFDFPDVRKAYLARFPHDPTGLDLDAWEAFEAQHPGVFGRMYQFWTEKRA